MEYCPVECNSAAKLMRMTQSIVAPADTHQQAANALYEFVGAAIARARGRDQVNILQVCVLRTLNRTGPRRITDLAATENLTQSAMTKIATTLQSAGLVERRPDPADGRATLIALTDVGSSYLTSRLNASADEIAELIDQLSAEERSLLLGAAAALERLAELSGLGAYQAGTSRVHSQRRSAHPPLA
jgi:DNA-binding MarR family transcriptional regulator